MRYSECRAAEQRSGDDLAVLLPLQLVERRFEHGEGQAEARGQVQAADRAGQVERLEHQLDQQADVQPGLGHVGRGRRRVDEAGFSGGHRRPPFPGLRRPVCEPGGRVRPRAPCRAGATRRGERGGRGAEAAAAPCGRCPGCRPGRPGCPSTDELTLGALQVALHGVGERQVVAGRRQVGGERQCQPAGVCRRRRRRPRTPRSNRGCSGRRRPAGRAPGRGRTRRGPRAVCRVTGGWCQACCGRRRTLRRRTPRATRRAGPGSDSPSRARFAPCRPTRRRSGDRVGRLRVLFVRLVQDPGGPVGVGRPRPVLGRRLGLQTGQRLREDGGSAFDGVGFDTRRARGRGRRWPGHFTVGAPRRTRPPAVSRRARVRRVS